ncbi:MAG TPA: acyl-ACP--UDP-N-acetylglucosamine O-acyltransferase [Prolixibacteraceae bacterium]|nr:acyl-ACP--UDP-N-acetylglucosamine O-acyltransferase [Prolixibacteraceae bacterium]HPR60569.1 acyl-ACP--UDP-N-acetylglucosamine O-acyltransferase [Prolixibacteraceae bacterium]
MDKIVNIHPNAQIGENVVIESFVSIAADVIIGDGTWIGPNAVIMDGSRIGKNCKIFPGAVIGGIPQDLKFKGEETTVVIGDNTTVREFVTINRGTAAKGTTIVGSNCLLQSYSHIAHDCLLKDYVILGSYAGLAGEVVVDDHAIVSPYSAVHQFCHVGKHAFTGGGSLVRKDIPPYIIVANEPLSYTGVNSVGLRRRGFSVEKINEIQNVYRYFYQKGLNTTQAINAVETEMELSIEVLEILNFIKSSERGIIRGPND